MQESAYRAPKSRIVDQFGDAINFTTSWGEGIIDMSTEAIDYSIERVRGKMSHIDVSVNSFSIIPETSGVIKVRLENMKEGEIYTVTAAQVTAYIGKPLPKRIIEVYKTDTTATFSVEV